MADDGSSREARHVPHPDGADDPEEPSGATCEDADDEQRTAVVQAG
jgi:hypothetical protein